MLHVARDDDDDDDEKMFFLLFKTLHSVTNAKLSCSVLLLLTGECSPLGAGFPKSSLQFSKNMNIP